MEWGKDGSLLWHPLPQSGEHPEHAGLAKPMLQIKLAELNANPMLLGVGNGVIDLNSGCFLCCSSSPFADQCQPCFISRSCLSTLGANSSGEITCGDTELATFLQRCGATG